MKFFRDLDTVLRLTGGYFFKKKYPISVTFITTYRCNFRCHYCGTWQQQADELSTGEVFKMIDELTSLGLRRLGLNGGEPLLRGDIGEIISYAKDQGLAVTLFTNGWLVKENIEKLKKLDVLLISFDGPAQVQDLQRQSGSYNKVIEAVKSAQDAHIKVWTNTVISKHNVDHIDFILGTADGYGFKTSFQPVYFYAHSSPQDQIHQIMPPRKDYIAAVDKIIDAKTRGGPVVHTKRYLEYIKQPDWPANKRRCWAGRFYFAITPDGRVAPCYPVFASGNWPSGRNMGYELACNSIGSFSCGGCFCILAENDFFFSLKPDVVLNTINQVG